MPKGLNKEMVEVMLAFTADTSKAKKEVQNLQNQLSKIMQSASMKSAEGGITKELQEASQAAAQLKAHLSEATNVKTGKLDLGLLDKSFKNAGMSLNSYRDSLVKLGPEGEQAFKSLTRNILRAEAPLKQTSGILKEFSITLANTARWQISSTILHGFMGSIQTAYHYAQDLNESLNNIRIVTGQSTEQMADFAKRANESAKALNTTTTKYTDAALIYYQQGLSDEEVKERTDVTVKMANVAGQSAEEVSDQMTAVWNNFNKAGDESAEHFADVMTKLGAETASSTSEIATGLEKFAGIADTVGLSFDYASSALATITATSRETPEVVGTALKTIFARVQGLKLGETLEDGTDLNKYSQGLKAVGIEIKDASGEMKNMDNILDEMGAKWKTLSKDQQMALAQTVAGTRQYNQLMTLMANWDFFEENVQRAKNSEGTLQEQADIYAESWEAASHRVQAAAEELYSQLLDDEFFIKLTDGFAGFLGIVSDLIDGLGGVQGVLALIGTTATKVFSKEMAQGINNFIYNLQDPEVRANEMRNQALISASNLTKDTDYAYVNELLVTPQQAFYDNADQMTEFQRKTGQYLLDQYEAEVNNLQILEQQKATLQENCELRQQEYEEQLELNTLDAKSVEQTEKYKNTVMAAPGVEQKTKDATKLISGKKKLSQDLKNEVANIFSGIDLEQTDFSEPVQKAIKGLQSGNGTITQVKNNLKTLKSETDLVDNSFNNLKNTLDKNSFSNTVRTVDDLIEAEDSLKYKTEEISNEQNRLAEQGNILAQNFQNTSIRVATTGDVFTATAGAISGIAMSISSLIGLFDVWSNEDMSMGDKLLSTFTSLGLVIPMAISSFKGLSTVLQGVQLNTGLLKILNTGLGESFLSLNGVQLVNISTGEALNAAKIAEIGTNEALAASNYAVQASLGALLIPILALAAAIAAIIAIGYGLVKLFEAIHAASPEGQLESMTEAAKQASKAYEELGKVVSDVKNEFDKYHEIKNTLSGLTTGTEEWRNAVLQLNEQILLLIDKYPELAKGMKITNGVITLDEDVIKEFNENLQKDYADLGYRKAQTNYNKTNKEIEVTDRSEGYSNYKEKQAENYRNTNEKNYLLQKESYDRIIEAGIQNGTDILSDLNELKQYTNPKAAKQIANDAELQATLAAEITKEKTKQLTNENSLTTATSSYLATAAKDNKDYQKLVTSKEQADQEAIKYISEQARKYQKDNSEQFKTEINKLNKKSEEEIQSKWASKHHYTKDGEDYVNSSGQVQEFDLENAKTELASMEIMAKFINDDLTELSKKIPSILKSINGDYKDSISNFISTGSADSFSRELRDKFFMDGEAISAENIDLQKLFGLSEEQIKNLGYKNGEDFVKAIQEAINNSDINLDNFFESLSNKTKLKTIDLSTNFGFDTSEFSNQDQMQIYQTLENAGQNSDVALQGVGEIFSLGADKARDFSQAVKDIDWSNVKSIGDTVASIQEKAHLSDDFTDSIRNYAQQMTLAAQATEQTKHSIDDSDVTENKEQWEGLSATLQGLAREGRGVDKALASNKEAADEAAAELLRYDHAVEEVTKNYDEWMAQLSSDNIMDNAEAIGELKDIYGDLLDIDPSSLSEGFISSTENLELMRQAAEGSEEAYQQLQQLAQQDMEAQLHIGIDDVDFWNAKAQIQTALDEMSFQDLEVGANLDIGNFLNSLSDMVNAAGMTQQQATDYLSNMGIDAQVETTDVAAKPTTKRYVGVKWTPGQTTATGNLPIIGSYEYSLPTFHPEPDILETTEDGGTFTAHALKVTSANKSSGGNFKFSNSSHGGGNAGQKARSSGGGGKGGGGGSEKQPKQPQHKDHKDPLKELADRYHDLNKAIQDVEHAMSMLSKTQDHLVGSALAKSLKEQNKLLEQQKGNYQALNNELRKEQGELQNILGFLGGSFDAYGGILNYADVFNNIQNAYNESVNSYNQTIDWFNSLSGDEQEEFGKSGVDFAEKMLEQVKKDYDEANKYLSRYDEVYSELQKNDEKLQELLYQQIENNLKIFEVEIQVKLDISEAQRKVNDFLRDIRKNFRTLYTETEDWAELFTTAIKDANTLAGAEGTINTRLRQIQEVRSALDNPSYNYNSNMSLFVDRSEAIDKLKEYTEELMSESEDLYNLYEDSWNSYLDAMDEALDQWDDILEGFEDINDTLDHYEKVAEMLYGGEDAAAGRKLLESLYNMSATNSLGAQTALRAELDSLNKELSELYARGALDGEQDIEKLKETIREKTHELESEQEHFLEVIQNRLLNSIKTIIDTADKALTRGFGGNKIVERWNDAKEAAEGYYDEIERVYQLENLESKWEKAINDTSTIKNQQYLKTLMDNQLSNLRSKTKLSEYNITLAEKELAIYQAQMALEDARNNKNTMKLVRNEQGDWTYQYVADEEDVNAKEEELLNAMYDKYEYVKQSSADATEAILDLYNTANEKLSELMQEYTNADEERRAELAEEYDYWYNYYWGEDGLIVQKVAEAQDMETDLQTAGMETLWQLYEQDKDNFDLMTQVEKDLITELKEHGVDSLKTLELERDKFYKATEMQTAHVIDTTRTTWEIASHDIIKQWNGNTNSVRTNIQNAYDQIMTKVDEYDQAIIKSEFISGMALADVEGQLNRVGDKIQDNIYKIDDMTNKTDQLSTFREYVDLVGFAWYGVRNAIEEATSALDRYLRMLNGEDTSGGGGGPTPDAGPADGGGNAGGGGGGELSAEEWAALGETVALGIAQNIYTYGSWGDEPVRHGRITERYGEEMANRVQEIINELYRSGNTGFLYNPDSSIWGFATGGYTGDWDGKGRLALLHQKELVLNEKDTENILDAVNIVRTIKDSIGSMVSSITNLTPESIAAASNVNNSDKKVFNITAEFPNANNVTEIQEAILGLPNLASQWMSANG